VLPQAVGGGGVKEFRSFSGAFIKNGSLHELKAFVTYEAVTLVRSLWLRGRYRLGKCWCCTCTCHQRTQVLVPLGFTVPPHPLYSLHVMPWHYALLDETKDPLHGHWSSDNTRRLKASKLAVLRIWAFQDVMLVTGYFFLETSNLEDGDTNLAIWCHIPDDLSHHFAERFSQVIAYCP
jgi:hypothetical protein